MKKMIKIAALLMVLIFAVGALAACDNGGNDTSKTDDNGGNGATKAENNGGNQPAAIKTEEWGYFQVLVPDGYTLTGGNALDHEDPGKLLLNKDADLGTYFMLGLYTEEEAKMGLETTVEFNEGTTEVTTTCNGVTWTGVVYESLGYQCMQMYADFGDNHFVVVNGAGNAYDSDVTNAVLSSIVLNVTE